MSGILLLLRWSVIGLLVLFMVRRLLLLVASGRSARSSPLTTSRSITLLVAAHNEARSLPALLAALERLQYPAASLRAVLVSDGSDDATAALMRAWHTAPYPYDVIELPEGLGKGGALAAGLARAAESELVVVFDADCVPEPDVLQRLAGAFVDPSVGAAAAFPKPANSATSIVARYAALERYVHHLVTLAGRDRLGLNPPIVGVAFAVRREALEQAGGFPSGVLAEDTSLSLALVQAGWRLRWLGDAIVREDVVTTRARFLAQRRRWSRGLLQSAGGARTFEDRLAAAGYLDRVVLLLALLLAPFGVVAPWWPVAYLTVPAVSAVFALRRAGDGPIHSFAWAAVLMFASDVLSSVHAAAGHVAGTAVPWGTRDASE